MSRYEPFRLLSGYVKIARTIGEPQPRARLPISKLERQFVAQLQSDQGLAPSPQVPPFGSCRRRRTRSRPSSTGRTCRLRISNRTSCRRSYTEAYFFCHLYKNRSSCCRTSSPCSRPRRAHSRSRPCLGLARRILSGGRPCLQLDGAAAVPSCSAASRTTAWGGDDAPERTTQTCLGRAPRRHGD